MRLPFTLTLSKHALYLHTHTRTRAPCPHMHTRTAHRFVLCMCMELGIVDDTVLRPFIKQFRHLDISGEGCVDRASHRVPDRPLPSVFQSPLTAWHSTHP